MDIFCITAPGQHDFLAAEAREKGFKVTDIIPGGITIRGDWPDVWRANLQLRGTTRVLARLTEFRALYLSQLELNTREYDWPAILPKYSTVEVEATCHKSKIYHAGAAKERVETALAGHGFVTPEAGYPADISIRVRIDRDIVTLSLDTSGESLHKRGHKEAVNKAPMRETMASMFLREAKFNGKIPLFDPMCGSGTFVIEAAEIARRFDPGRTREFTFQSLPNFDATAFADMGSPDRPAAHPIFGSDRDQGAIVMSKINAQRAGVTDITTFEAKSIGDITPPTDAKGLVITNPPYGGRIGNKTPLFGLYSSFGDRLKTQFKGWRAAIVTSDDALAKATGLPFKPAGPIVNHGGIKIRLWQTDPLA